MVWYMPLHLACIVPGIVPVQGIFGLCCIFGEFSIPWFATFCPIWCVCHCHQWHVPDNQFCLRINKALILISKTVTLWVVEALSLCALCALGCSESIWIYHLDIHVQTFQGSLKYSSHQLLKCGGCIGISHLHYSALKSAKYCRECCFSDILWSYVHLLISLCHIQLGSEFSSGYIMTYYVLIWERCYVFPHILVLLLQIEHGS